MLLIVLPTIVFGASIGVWLFYVQHQFEETHWDRTPDWEVQDAALHGSSYYVLPPVLRWFTANIGVHHVHHLLQPNSVLPALRSAAGPRVLARAKRITLMESFDCARRHLWDENRRKLLSFAEARSIAT